MTQDKKRRILDMLVVRYNIRSYAAAALEKSDLKLASYTNREAARDLLEVIIVLAKDELVDIKSECKACDGIKYDMITAEWA